MCELGKRSCIPLSSSMTRRAPEVTLMHLMEPVVQKTWRFESSSHSRPQQLSSVRVVDVLKFRLSGWVS